jgi:hypothetical protein
MIKQLTHCNQTLTSDIIPEPFCIKCGQRHRQTTGGCPIRFIYPEILWEENQYGFLYKEFKGVD